MLPPCYHMSRGGGQPGDASAQAQRAERCFHPATNLPPASGLESRTPPHPHRTGWCSNCSMTAVRRDIVTRCLRNPPAADRGLAPAAFCRAGRAARARMNLRRTAAETDQAPAAAPCCKTCAEPAANPDRSSGGGCSQAYRTQPSDPDPRGVLTWGAAGASKLEQGDEGPGAELRSCLARLSGGHGTDRLSALHAQHAPGHQPACPPP